MSTPKQTVLVIGGTGAQGVPVVKALTSDSKYIVNVLTRSPTSHSALELASLPNTTIISGNAYADKDLHSALSGIDIVFANTNGFAIGEKAEIYWGIRIYELAREHGVKHFIWASLDSGYKLSGYQSRFRDGHLDGKHKVADWISTQDKGGMKWSILTSCMYAEMLSEFLVPSKEIIDGEETLVFSAPVGSGSPPLIHLNDLGRYARWLVDYRSLSDGMNLRIATEHISWTRLAQTVTEVTGRKAIFRDVTQDQYFSSGAFPDPDEKVGHSVDKGDETLQSYRENFGGFWNVWKEDVIVRDFAILDEILPDRVKSIKEWMVKTGYTGERGSVLKDYRDAGRAKPNAS